MKALLLLLVCVFAEDLIDYDKAQELKDKGVTWKVADPSKNPLRRQSLESFKKMLHGSKKLFKEEKPDETEAVLLAPKHDEEPIDADDIPVEDQEARAEYDKWGLPVNFDGRQVWGACIHPASDQGTCNGCWAFAIIGHLSDRFCVQGKNIILSVQDLLECTAGNKCCGGGYASNGYRYMMETGVVAESCKRYRNTCGECTPSSCTRYKCKPNSMFWADTIQQAKREIQNNGPIEAVLDVYDDFPYYESGVYYRTSNTLMGVHTVEVLGWGTENGMNYWLCKNSWGDSWGDNGFFKIKMGDCDVNSGLTTCAPLIK
jgi:cathepsin B